MTDVVEIGARAIRIALNRGVHFRDDTGEVAILAALAALNEAGYVVVERREVEKAGWCWWKGHDWGDDELDAEGRPEASQCKRCGKLWVTRNR